MVLEKHSVATQYNDYLKDYSHYLVGEEKHGSDDWIINSLKEKEKIHLFIESFIIDHFYITVKYS